MLAPPPLWEAAGRCWVNEGAVIGAVMGAEPREFEWPTDEWLGAGALFWTDGAERGDETGGDAWRAGLELPPREKLGIERGAAGVDWETRGADGRDAGIEALRPPDARPIPPPPAGRPD